MTKKSSRPLLILSLLGLTLVTSRCECARSDNSSGRCAGAIGSLQFSDEIDPKSWYAVDWDRGVNMLDFSFGNRKLHINGEVARADVLSGGMVLNLPGEAPSGGTTDGGTGSTDGGTGGVRPGSPEIKSWTLVAPASRPRLSEGTLDRSLTFVELRLSATLRMVFEDGSVVLCTFELARDEDRDVGKDPSESEGGGGCPSGGGGDSDFD